MKRFVITGTGRCGTMWMARALTTLGYRCGHESVFNPRTLEAAAWRARIDRDGCDSSWLAMAVLGDLPNDVAVIHLVRDPLDTVRSFMGIRFFAANDEYAKVARSLVVLPDDELAAACAFWLEVNRRAAARADATVRIEDPDALLRVLQVIDPQRLSLRRVRSVVVGLAPQNRRERDETVSSVPTELQEASRLWGYP